MVDDQGSVSVLRGQFLKNLTAAVAAVSVGACGTDRSVLDPSSPGARDVADLGWWLIATSTVVTLGVFVLLGYGLVRRRRGTEDGDDGEGTALRWLLGGGVILPVVVILPLIGMSVAILDDDAPGVLQVEVIGHQFWWEYRYPQHDVTTANELYIPVGERVALTLRSDDVIHSFWVPELGGKTDLVPGHVTNMTLEADRAGSYPGQCAEHCGLQHAKMRLLVVAQEPGEFQQWLADQRADAVGATEGRGAELFSTQGCAACHTIRGTDADGRLGPDLTHLASRRTLGAAIIENTPANLRRWIDETWEIKDGIAMPEVPLGDDEVEAIAAYLETLE